MAHSYKIADNIVYIAPATKLLSSTSRMQELEEYGGIYKMILITPKICGFPFGYPVMVFHLKRGYKGKTEMIIHQSIKDANTRRKTNDKKNGTK